MTGSITRLVSIENPFILEFAGLISQYVPMLCRVLVLMALLHSPIVFAQAPGIYADFTTSMGTFVCQLDYTNAPKAVASFVGLATGELGWMDPNTGNRRTAPFYNGLIFHRVIANFMIQGGCPKGQGTSGPGYTFVDEVNTNTFNQTGLLAMANSGPDSNGSQFFVTVSTPTHLNGVHTIFGQVVSNYSVVDAISKVATVSDRPVTPVVIQSVGIRREGSAAQAFNIHGQGLATVTNIPLTFSKASANLVLGFTNKLHSESFLFFSSDLRSWWNSSGGVETQGALSQWYSQFNWPISEPAEFFKMTQVQYPSTRPAPKSLVGSTIAFEFSGGTGGLGTNTTQFTGEQSAIYVWPKQNVNVATPVYYQEYSQDAYRGRVRYIYWKGLPFMIHMSFSTASQGSFAGEYYSGSQSTKVSGLFRFK